MSSAPNTTAVAPDISSTATAQSIFTDALDSWRASLSQHPAKHFYEEVLDRMEPNLAMKCMHQSDMLSLLSRVTTGEPDIAQLCPPEYELSMTDEGSEKCRDAARSILRGSAWYFDTDTASVVPNLRRDFESAALKLVEACETKWPQEERFRLNVPTWNASLSGIISREPQETLRQTVRVQFKDAEALAFRTAIMALVGRIAELPQGKLPYSDEQGDLGPSDFENKALAEKAKTLTRIVHRLQWILNRLKTSSSDQSNTLEECHDWIFEHWEQIMQMFLTWKMYEDV